MSRRPVLVVHGIANHDQTGFEQRVTTLQRAIHAELPNLQLIPVFWGDLGGASKDIVDSLPQFAHGQWTTRASEILSSDFKGVEVRAEPMSNEERAAVITGSAMSANAVRSELDTTTAAIADALDQTEYLQKIDDPELLQEVGNIVNDALRTDHEDRATGQFAVRSDQTSFETRGWIGDRVKGVIAGVDKLIGRLVEDHLGVFNQRLRGSLMNVVAMTLGDIVAYHSNKEKIQRRLWDAINHHAPGYGTPAKPIGVIAHSLGGVVSFDAAVAPASGNALSIDSFVTFGSQPAFFEIMDPRGLGSIYSTGHPVALPATIRKWFNLWDVIDVLAFTAGTVFRLSDGSKPEDIAVEDPISKMLDAKLWLHSIYWTAPQLNEVLVKAFS